MSLTDAFFIVMLPAATVIAAVVFGIAIPRMQRRRRLHGPIPVTVLSRGEDVIPPRPDRPLSSRRNSPAAPVEPVAPPSPPPTPVVPTPQVQVASATGTHDVTPVDSRTTTSETPHLRLATSGPETPRASGRRTQRAVDATLQFLPGRLEIVEGRDVGQEIRFVRQPGEGTTVVTFGRSEGPQYRHIQLHEPTVSRVHAKISLEGKRWRLTNMSSTNPVLVNGQPLEGEGEGSSLVLSENDRVEMGEVVFKFRSR